MLLSADAEIPAGKRQVSQKGHQKVAYRVTEPA